MRINGIELEPFSKQQRRILVLLGLYAPRPMAIGELIECAYPDSDLEPTEADECIRRSIRRMRPKLHGWTITGIWGRGYILERTQ